MNLRLGNNKLLFKITEAELTALIEGATLEQQLELPGGPLIVCIDPAGKHEYLDPVLERGDSLRIRLPVSPDLLAMLQALGRDREGIQHQVGDTTVGLQVDVRSQRSP